MPEASFIYPQGGKFDETVNVVDQLDVTYTSQWSSLNLTLFCFQSATNNNYLYYNVNDNPILPNGTYLTPSIDSLQFGIRQYPVSCFLRLTEYKNNSNAVDSGSFTLTSTVGAARTFQQTQTSTDSFTHPTQTATGTAAGVFTTSTSGSQSTASATSPPMTGASSGISSVAVAGIGVGVSLGLILIAAVVGFLFWSKRKQQRSADVNRPPVSHDYYHFSKSDGREYIKSELPGGFVGTTPIYEPHSVERQELMAHQWPQHPKTDGRFAAEMP